ncbi:unnamed protein product [Rotaria sp. Silwood1]|nr:unnamed protein product [Rotaria sp. Silwood1]CAF0952259.1 unnamed protein product [Rotaria sp. Silwood1]
MSYFVIIDIPVNASWIQHGVTVAGGYERGSATNQLNNPSGLFVDDDQTILIADTSNHRVIQWKIGDTNGQVIAGGHGKGNRSDQLNYPTDVLINKETDNLIVCDRENRRVARWSRRSGTTQGEIIFDNIRCFGLAMDDQRYLYISDNYKHEVRRYRIGDKSGTVVAGGQGQGDGFNQLNWPTYIFVDRQQNTYVSDTGNHRVMKWNKDATEGIIVAGGLSNNANDMNDIQSAKKVFHFLIKILSIFDCVVEDTNPPIPQASKINFSSIPASPQQIKKSFENNTNDSSTFRNNSSMTKLCELIRASYKIHKSLLNSSENDHFGQLLSTISMCMKSVLNLVSTQDLS